MTVSETNELAEEISLTVPTQKQKSTIKNIVAWVVAAAIFAFLFWRIDRKMFIDSLSYANLYIYIPALIVFGIVTFLLDTQNLYVLFRYFDHTMRFGSLLTIRGVTYLLMVVNFSLGMGGILYFLKRDSDIPVKRGTGLMLVYNTSTQNSLFILSIIGCLIAPPSNIMQKILYFCVVCLCVNISWVAILKNLPDRGKFIKFKDLAWVKVYYEISFSDYFKLTFWRCVYYSIFIFFFYVGVRAFNMEIPFLLLTAYVPIVLLVISLPITPFGLGTSQAAMLLFFKDFGSEANILAFGIIYSTSVIIIRGIIGLFYLKKSKGVLPIQEEIQMESVNESV